MEYYYFTRCMKQLRKSTKDLREWLQNYDDSMEDKHNFHFKITHIKSYAYNIWEWTGVYRQSSFRRCLEMEGKRGFPKCHVSQF